MPTTSNFGWTTPADTDYVKDGALAIRTLGNGIDTSLIDLKGGTTGQILSKASNTDLDYTWINNDQGDITAVNVSSPITGGGTTGAVTISIQDGTTTQKGAVQLEDSTSSTSTTTAAVPASVKSAYDLANAAIPKSIVDAAGDLIYATANDTVARLALGTANQQLRVNSGATAPEWFTPAAAASGLTLITSTTLSGAASKNVDSVFTSTYKFYLIKYVGQSSNANDEIYLRFRTGGTTNTNASYYKQSINLTSTTVSGVTDTTGQTAIYLGDADTTNESHFEIFVYNPELAKRTALYCLTGGSYGGVLYTKSMRALFANTTSFDGFNIGSLNHNNTAEIRVYGYQD